MLNDPVIRHFWCKYIILTYNHMLLLLENKSEYQIVDSLEREYWPSILINCTFSLVTWSLLKHFGFLETFFPNCFGIFFMGNVLVITFANNGNLEILKRNTHRNLWCAGMYILCTGMSFEFEFELYQTVYNASVNVIILDYLQGPVHKVCSHINICVCVCVKFCIVPIATQTHSVRLHFFHHWRWRWFKRKRCMWTRLYWAIVT